MSQEKKKLKFRKRIILIADFGYRPVNTGAFERWMNNPPRKKADGTIIVPKEVEQFFKLSKLRKEITHRTEEGEIYIMAKSQDQGPGEYAIYRTTVIQGTNNRFLVVEAKKLLPFEQRLSRYIDNFKILHK